MKNLALRFWNDDRGFIISAEIVLVVTIGVLGMIVGINAVASAVNNELNDISSAIGALDQSYWYSGFVKFGHSGVVGSAFSDSQDFCDCTSIVPTPPPVKIQNVPNTPPVPVPPAGVPVPPPAGVVPPAVGIVPPGAVPVPPYGPVLPAVPEQTVFPPRVLHPPVPPCNPCDKHKDGKPVAPKGKHAKKQPKKK